MTDQTFPYHEVQVPNYRRIEFTKAQLSWIRRRDGEKCQYPFQHDCVGPLHVHHILPQFWARVRLQLDPWLDVNIPENAITVCQAIHVGRLDVKPDPHMLHPDHRLALWRHHMEHDKEAFKKVSESHVQMTLQGLKYWYFELDDWLKAYAIRATRKFEMTGDRFPVHHSAKVG